MILSKDSQEKINLDIGLSLYDDLVEVKEGEKVVKLKSFYFQKGRSTITPEIEVELDKVVEVVKYFPNIKLRIETYTDSRGSTSANLKVSQTRSNAIKKYLKFKEVPQANILESIGHGEDKILNDCGNGVYCLEFMHKKNQRSLIVILNEENLFK